MWELDHKESWAPKSWCFWTVALEKPLDGPLDCKEIRPVNPKGNQPKYPLEGLMLKLKFQYFGHLMRRTGSLEKTLMLGKTEVRRRRGWQDKMVGWHHRHDRRECEQALGVGDGQKPGMIQSMGSQRVGHHWATELNWELNEKFKRKYNIHDSISPK